MGLKKKVADFIRLEEGNIGRQAAVVTGALLASTTIGAVLTSPVMADHCNGHYDHANWWTPVLVCDHTQHWNFISTWTFTHCDHGQYQHQHWHDFYDPGC